MAAVKEMTAGRIFPQLFYFTLPLLMGNLLHDGQLREGQDLLVIDGKLFLSFKQAYDCYLDRFMAANLNRSLLLSAPLMRKRLSEDDTFLYSQKRRLAPGRGPIHCMVWRWNNQVRLPPAKLRKVN